MKQVPIAILGAFVTVIAFNATTTARGDDWPQFLGPDRNGISQESSLIDSFPPNGPRIAWRRPGGVGMSGIAVASNHVVTIWNSDDGELVASLDRKSGQLNWSTPLGISYENSMGDGPRATPTIVGTKVFAYGGSGQLACLNLSDGKKNWTTDVPDQLRVKPSEYGMASSPLVVGDQVIVTCGGSGSAVVALDVDDGSVRWTALEGAAGYSSPALLKIGDEQHLVTFTAAGLSGIDMTSGTVLWSYPFKTPYDCNNASPISVDGGVFISAGENHGCALLQVTRENEDYTVNEVWSSTMTKSVMRNEWQTSIALDGYLYGFDNVGSAGPTTHLACIEQSTGKPIWQKTRFGKGNLVAADGKLWISTMSGDFVIAKASPQGYRELDRAKVFGKTRQSFAIADGHAYIRDDQEVVCIDLRRE